MFTILRLWKEKKVRQPNQKASRVYKGRKRQKRYYEEGETLELQSSSSSDPSESSSDLDDETNLETWWNDNIISTSDDDSDGFKGY